MLAVVVVMKPVKGSRCAGAAGYAPDLTRFAGALLQCLRCFNGGKGLKFSVTSVTQFAIQTLVNEHKSGYVLIRVLAFYYLNVE